ncbi:MAG: riboflavin synthase subunit alpha [Deltaproteobacteria bacterium RIFCSPHIGHO2_12_FULL_43_9]|nr:MAG: riboflavin synthase subunit alpha [Deltaproteobacteria bacterium RIFCSPHIGHO2_12_FULL_43_9]
MFNGIIECLGTLLSKETTSGSEMLRFIIEADIVKDDIKIGDSIAVNGACLTIIETNNNQFLTEVSPETAQKTNLTLLEAGGRVNLERGIKVGERLNGHIVLGHVDTKIRRLQIERVEDGAILWFELPAEYKRYLIKKGSVALNGVSLTINDIKDERFCVFIIPHTIRNTNLLDDSSKLVNLEVDVIGKYIEQFVAPRDDETVIASRPVIASAHCHSRECGNPDPRFHGDDVRDPRFHGDDEAVGGSNLAVQ